MKHAHNCQSDVSATVATQMSRALCVRYVAMRECKCVALFSHLSFSLKKTGAFSSSKAKKKNRKQISR